MQLNNVLVKRARAIRRSATTRRGNEWIFALARARRTSKEIPIKSSARDDVDLAIAAAGVWVWLQTNDRASVCICKRRSHRAADALVFWAITAEKSPATFRIWSRANITCASWLQVMIRLKRLSI